MEPSLSSDGPADTEIYPGVWNDTINSPYQKIVTLLPSDDVAPGWQPPNHPQTFDFPLSPPSTPPHTSVQLTISPLQTILPLPFHQDDETLSAAAEPGTPSGSASPPLSPGSPNATVTVPTTPADVQSTQVAPTSASEDYTDGGTVSNMAALPVLFTSTTNVDHRWACVYLHCWHAVFHATHIHHPPASLIQLSNQALPCAYLRWDAVRPNEQLSSIFITINGDDMQAIRRIGNSPGQETLRFEGAFKLIIRKARQANMNRLFQCTLGAVITSQIVPFLPVPFPDFRLQSSDNGLIPRIYTFAQKRMLIDSVTWNHQFGCAIWHHFDGPRVLWFASNSVRNYLAVLLSPYENAPYTLGVRCARRVDSDQISSWGPVRELDNSSVLVLLAKLLASLSISISYDVAQSSQLSHEFSDPQRNSMINKVTNQVLKLLWALDDVTSEYPHLAGETREEGHTELVRLKDFLGFASS